LKKSLEKLKDEDIKSSLYHIVDSFKVASPKKEPTNEPKSAEDNIK
jgi:hypothetical protein